MQVNTTSGSNIPVDYRAATSKVDSVSSTEQSSSVTQDYSDKVTISAAAAELLNADKNSTTTEQVDTGTGIEPPQNQVDTGTGIEPPQNQADTGTGIEPPQKGV